MRSGRRLLLRIAMMAASAASVVFVLATVFCFGLATHRDASLSWYKSSSNADLVQVIFCRGQGQLTVNFLHFPGFPGPAGPRGWHAGIRYLPGIDPNLRISAHAGSRYGLDVYWDQNGPRLYAGVFGLYPVVVLWALVWLMARRKARQPGHCPGRGYDLRASPARCPECGQPVHPALTTAAAARADLGAGGG